MSPWFLKFWGGFYLHLYSQMVQLTKARPAQAATVIAWSLVTILQLRLTKQQPDSKFCKFCNSWFQVRMVIVPSQQFSSFAIFRNSSLRRHCNSGLNLKARPGPGIRCCKWLWNLCSFARFRRAAVCWCFQLTRIIRTSLSTNFNIHGRGILKFHHTIVNIESEQTYSIQVTGKLLKFW